MRISDWSSDVCSSDLLQVVGHLLLEVAVGRAARHAADRAHAAIGLVGAALEQEHLADALLGAGHERDDHGAARSPPGPAYGVPAAARKSLVSGKSVAVHEDLGDGPNIQKKKKQ